MPNDLNRRSFMQVSAAGSFLTLSASSIFAAETSGRHPALISPGCRKTKVKVGRIYIGIPKALWPDPTFDIVAEKKRYEAEFERMEKEFADVEFVGNELVTKLEELQPLKTALKDADGILVIHLSMGIGGILKEILDLKKPTVLFAVPYSGHEWANFGNLRKQKEGELLECLLTSDTNQLATAVRPFRAIHHLREAKIINVTSNELNAQYLQGIKDRFGTEIKRIGKEPVIEAYNSITDADAEAETQRWISGALAVIEPSRDEIFRSCKLALAFQKIIDAEAATVMTVDCYGSMYHQLPAFPCIGFVRLSNMGLGGICESDLSSAMTHVIFQGLCGKPGFISDPTVDESQNVIILAHCLGSTKMDGPDEEAAPYKLRTVHERQEGAVPQAIYRRGEKVTQAILTGTDKILYFTGEIMDTPEFPRGCRTKIAVKVDGDLDTLWNNWSHGLHRQTCYGNIVPDLKRFCRFKGIQLINEAV